jgi:hypothetical protein
MIRMLQLKFLARSCGQSESSLRVVYLYPHQQCLPTIFLEHITDFLSQKERQRQRWRRWCDEWCQDAALWPLSGRVPREERLHQRPRRTLWLRPRWGTPEVTRVVLATHKIIHPARRIPCFVALPSRINTRPPCSASWNVCIRLLRLRAGQQRLNLFSWVLKERLSASGVLEIPHGRYLNDVGFLHFWPNVLLRRGRGCDGKVWVGGWPVALV